jgi:hypothetical protein
MARRTVITKAKIGLKPKATTNTLSNAMKTVALIIADI